MYSTLSEIIKDYGSYYLDQDVFKSYEKEILDIFNSIDDDFDNCTDSNLLYVIGVYCDITYDDDDQNIKYWTMSAMHTNMYAMLELANYYRNDDKYEMAKMYWMLAVNLKSINAMFELGMFYKYAEFNHDLMLKYLTMAAENNVSDAMYELGTYYGKINNVPLKLKYLHDAVKHNNQYAMCELGIHHQYTDDKCAIKYFIMSLQLNCSSAMFAMRKVYISKMRQYSILSEVVNPSNIIIEWLSELYKCPEVMKLHKMKLIFERLKNIKKCYVCDEVKLNVIDDESDELCIDCYII